MFRRRVIAQRLRIGVPTHGHGRCETDLPFALSDRGMGQCPVSQPWHEADAGAKVSRMPRGAILYAIAHNLIQGLKMHGGSHERDISKNLGG